MTPQTSIDASSTLRSSGIDKVPLSSSKVFSEDKVIERKSATKDKSLRSSRSQLDLSPIPVGKQQKSNPSENHKRSQDPVILQKSTSLDAFSSLQLESSSSQEAQDSANVLSSPRIRNEVSDSIREKVTKARDWADKVLLNNQGSPKHHSDADRLLEVRTSRSAINPPAAAGKITSLAKQYPQSAEGFKAPVPKYAPTSSTSPDNIFCEKHKLEKCVLCHLFNPKPSLQSVSTPHRANNDNISYIQDVLTEAECGTHKLKDCLLCSLRSNRSNPSEMSFQNVQHRTYTVYQGSTSKTSTTISDEDFIQKSSAMDSMVFFDQAKQQLEDALNRGEARRAEAANSSAPSKISEVHSPVEKLTHSFEKHLYSDRNSFAQSALDESYDKYKFDPMNRDSTVIYEDRADDDFAHNRHLVLDEKAAYDYFDEEIETQKVNRDKREVRFHEDVAGSGTGRGNVKKKKSKSMRITKSQISSESLLYPVEPMTEFMQQVSTSARNTIVKKRRKKKIEV